MRRASLRVTVPWLPADPPRRTQQSETQEASSPISYASDEESSSSSFSPEPASSSSGTPRLHDLLRFVDEHKAAALASKDQKERKKRQGKEPPPVTPRQAAAQTLEDLQLDSAHAGVSISATGFHTFVPLTRRDMHLRSGRAIVAAEAPSPLVHPDDAVSS